MPLLGFYTRISATILISIDVTKGLCLENILGCHEIDGGLCRDECCSNRRICARKGKGWWQRTRSRCPSMD